MNKQKAIFMLSISILLFPFIVLGIEQNSIKADPDALFLIDTPQYNLYNFPFLFSYKNRFFSTFSNNSNKKNNKEFVIELNIDSKTELNTIKKENYFFKGLNLNYSNKVKIINSPYQLYGTKDEKSLFKHERGINSTTYELLKIFGAIIAKY